LISFYSYRKRSSSCPRSKNHNMGAGAKGKLSCKTWTRKERKQWRKAEDHV